MMLRALALVPLFATGAGALELTSGNWDAETSGKSVFIKFQAPWCGHCKKLKPDWDRLMEDFADSSTSLVADVDCTADGKDLCEEHGVKGYPTIKYGDPSNLQDYNGERTYEGLKKFADESLGPSCSPANVELCNEEQKAQIEKFEKMSEAKRDAKIRKMEKEMDKVKAEFEEFQKKLQETYEAESKKQDEKIADIKKNGLTMLKAVHAHHKAPAKDKESEL